MKKIILILTVTGSFLSLISCKKDKGITPEQTPIHNVTTTDTLAVKVFFSDNINFTQSDYTVTVVDVTNGDNSVVFVDSVSLDGILTPTNTAYTGKTIKLPRTSGVDRLYKIYLGGRKSQAFTVPVTSQTVTVVSGNVKDTSNVTLNTATPNYTGQPYKWGYGELMINAAGILVSQPHANAAFYEIDPNGTYIIY